MLQVRHTVDRGLPAPAPPTPTRTDRAQVALDRSRRMLSSLAAGHDLDDLASTVVRATGIGCQILTATGRRVCAVGHRLTEDEVDEVLSAAQHGRHFPLGALGRTVIPVSRVRGAARAWFLVVDSPPPLLSADAMDAFTEFASVAALVAARDADSMQLADRRDELVAEQILAGADGSGDGAEPSTGVVVVVRCADPDQVRPLVRDVLVTLTGAAAVAVAGGDVVAHVPVRPSGLAETLRRHLRRVVPLVDGELAVGYCEVAQSSVGGAVRGARQAADRGRDRVRADGDGESLSVTSASQLGTAATLFSHVPDQVRRDFVRRVLGPLHDYDATTGAGLVETLDSFMAHGCSWVRTADAMHMHQNTVRYRIGRVEELTRRDLSDTGDRVDLRLALDLR